MKNSFIICLAIAGGMFACACSDNAIDFGCSENNNHCDTENGIDVCYICAETVSGGRQWVKEICFYGKSEDGNSCKQFCATEWDDVNKQCIKVANCFLDSNELDGSCKKVDGCNKHKIDGSCECYKDKQNDDGTCEKTKNCVLEQWNEDGSCKRIENCVQAKWNEDGSCTPIADCVNGNSLDGKCNMIEGCTIGNNLDGSCIKVPDCFIKDENGNDKNANDGSCEKVVGCTAWYPNGTCMGCENGLNDDSGQCKCPDECTNGCEANGACKCSDAITCVTGCDIHTGNCTCPPTCAAGCHEDGSCKTPGSCATDNDCLEYTYCNDSSQCYCEQRDTIPARDNREKGKCYFTDSNHNHMYDFEETLYWNETECVHTNKSKCDKLGPVSFCDSFLDYHCSTKCTDSVQCLPGFICRKETEGGDGRCAADSFTTVWNSELRKETLEFKVSKEDAGVYICWDWKEIDKDNDDYCTVEKCECKTEECKSRTKDIQFHIPTEDEFKKYPEFKWATCPVPFQYIEKAAKDESQKKYDVYTINHNYNEVSNHHKTDATDDIKVKVYGELNGFSVSAAGDNRRCKDSAQFFHFEYRINENRIAGDCFEQEGKSDQSAIVFKSIDCNGSEENKKLCNNLTANPNNYLTLSECKSACKSNSKCKNECDTIFQNNDYDLECIQCIYNPGPSRSNLLDILSFGRVGLGWHEKNLKDNLNYYSISNYHGAFHDCYNLTTLSSTDIPDPNKLDMTSIFRGNCLFNTSLEHWDVSKVIAMERAFMSFNCQPGNSGGSYEKPNHPSFNSPLGKWDVSNVKTMCNMFGGSPFDQPINDWDVSNVEDLAGMFGTAGNEYLYSHFNQNIDSWDVSKVRRMKDMFTNAAYFNQNLSKWNVSNVEDMTYMFNGATSFNQDLSKWKVKDKATRVITDDCENNIQSCILNNIFFNSGMQNDNYCKIMKSSNWPTAFKNTFNSLCK